MKNDINRKNKIVILILIVVIMLPFLFTGMKRAFIISTNPDQVIYTHKNSKFINYVDFVKVNEAKIYILEPKRTGLFGLKTTYYDGAKPNIIDIVYVNIIDDIKLNTIKYTRKKLYKDDLKNFDINKIYADYFKKTIHCNPQLYVFEDGQQIITYQKYNKVYLHVVEDKYKTKETLLK